jgi:hypothetical protein
MYTADVRLGLTTYSPHQRCPIRLFSDVGMKRETREIGQERRIRNWAAIACRQNACTVGKLYEMSENCKSNGRINLPRPTDDGQSPKPLLNRLADSG